MGGAITCCCKTEVIPCPEAVVVLLPWLLPLLQSLAVAAATRTSAPLFYSETVAPAISLPGLIPLWMRNMRRCRLEIAVNICRYVLAKAWSSTSLSLFSLNRVGEAVWLEFDVCFIISPWVFLVEIKVCRWTKTDWRAVMHSLRADYIWSDCESGGTESVLGRITVWGFPATVAATSAGIILTASSASYAPYAGRLCSVYCRTIALTAYLHGNYC